MIPVAEHTQGSKRKRTTQQKNSDNRSRSSSSDSELSLASSTEGSDETEDRSWIARFCSRRGNEFFVEVDKSWIEDDFNLYHLPVVIQHYEFALHMILDRETEEDLNEKQVDAVQRSAEKLYGVLHARFIVTPRGLELMSQKFLNVDFGRCPRVYCESQPVLPIGQSDLPRNCLTKVLCPRCQEIYYPSSPRHSQIDGAYFGTTFAHLFLQVYPEFIPPPPKHTYVPRIFGFKIHHTSRQVLLEEAQKRKKNENNVTENKSTDNNNNPTV